MRNLFSRSALHEHADPAQRAAGVAALAPDSPELLALLAEDPAPEVRAAAALRIADPAPVEAAWYRESDKTVRGAIATVLFGTERCTDEIRAEIARHGATAEQRKTALAAINSESVLLDLALDAEHAETRKAAAERVASEAGLRKLAETAANTDRGVARIARQKVHAIEGHAEAIAAADDIIAQLEALATTPGAILSAMVDLERRWQTLPLDGEPERIARHEAARQVLQARFEREQDEQRERTRFTKSWQEWIATLAPPASLEALAAKRVEYTAFFDEATARSDPRALEALAEAGERLATWERALQAQAETEARVLAERTAAVADAARTEQAGLARQRIHTVLHAAEQALAAGQLQAARASADEIKPLRPAAGMLPKPTVQRISQLMQKLGDMERWENFGQQSARLQLCERAEALAAATLDAAKTAQEVQKLRDEWKALDQQHAGKVKVPQSIWARFDGACTKAYAPAARFFAERAAQRKQARGQRETFIAEVAVHAPTLLAAEPRDWRGMERWLRETDQKWREGELGSVEPGTWKKLDAELRAAMAPIREALAAHRSSGKAGREALIAEAKALVGTGRDAMTKLKDIQTRWQAHAKDNPIAHRDERALWEQFRAACDEVVNSRNAERKKEDDRKNEGRRGLDDLCAELERLAQPSDTTDGAIRSTLRDLESRWNQAKRAVRSGDPALGRLEGRFRSGRNAVEALLRERERARKATMWLALEAKEKLCDALDRIVANGSADGSESTSAAWGTHPELPAAWEKKLTARRDAALGALADAAARDSYAKQIEKGTARRRNELLELELAVGIEPPAEYQAARRALQLQQLKDRFSGAASPASNTQSVAERLVGWCAQPGALESTDRERADRVFAAIAK